MRKPIRITIWVVFGIATLCLFAAAVVLVPAHLQVRRVEPALPTVEQLRALLHRPDGPVAVRYINTSEQPIAGGTLTHSVFVIEWANGDLFMIDTGMPPDVAASFGEFLETLTDAGPARIHGTVEQFLGENVARVQGVGYTHLHRDHTQGTTGFCTARGGTVQLMQTRWQAEEHNFGTRAGAEIVRASCLKPTALEGDLVLGTPRFPGLGLVALGGHTPDSTMFVVPVGDTLYLFAGDITNTRTEMLDDIPKAWLYSTLIVPEHVERTAMLRRWLAKLDAEPDIRVVVSHDLDDIRASGIAAVE